MRPPASNTSTPVAAWPPADAEAWRRARLPADPFDPLIGHASRWRETTHRMLEECYGYWITWLARCGRLDGARTAADRASHENLAAYLEHLRQGGLADYTVAARLQRLGQMLKAMHPDRDWSWIERAASRIRTHATPRRDKRLCMPATEDLVALGEALIAAAETVDPTPAWWAASLARDGLIIGLLAMRPLRRRNLAGLMLGRHVARADGAWVIRIEGEETKNKEVIHCDWPEGLVEPLERYLATHRLTLLGSRAEIMGRCGPLWISRQEGQLQGGAIYGRVRHWTAQGLGVANGPHSARHAAATHIATNNPAGAADIKAVLGHASLRSSDAYYNQARMISAGDTYHRTIADLRRGRRPRQR